MSIYQDYKGRASHSFTAFDDIYCGRRYRHIKINPVSTIPCQEEVD